MKIAIIDIVFIGLLLLTTLVGLIKGFIGSFFGKASFIVGVLCGVFFASKFEPVINKFVSVPYLSLFLSFLVIFICTYLLLRLVQLVISGIFSIPVLSGLDKSLGVFWGLIEGLLIIGVFITIMYLQPFFDVTRLFENSFFVNGVYKYFVNPEQIQESINVTARIINNFPIKVV